MSIREDIEKKYKQSLKERNVNLTNTIRLIKSAIKNKDIAARSLETKEEIKDQEILSLLQNLIKQRKDSIEAFKIADRQDLIEKEQSEIQIINLFLPQQKNEKETENIINQLIQEQNLNSLKDMGKLMSFLKKDYSGEIDMGLAGKIAKLKLSI
ncbi:uncharacterized protein METZ01_LOCUS172786 [marine metagenome]|uniref:GatB/YqeY domain-containing protein n=1 Tax=marine metagenome TaxID=408172 RepID=A0A382C2D9_9ZZZZ